MKTVAVAVASLLTVVGPAAQAAYDRYGNYYEPSDYRSPDRGTARVIESRPVYTGATGREECWNDHSRRFEDPRRSEFSSLNMEHCRTVATLGSTLVGYDVRYVYRGNEYVARMSSDPGRRLVLGRDVRDDGSPYEYAANAPTYTYNDPSYDPTLR